MLECLRANANIQTERRLLLLLTFYGIVITLLHIGEPSCGVKESVSYAYNESHENWKLLKQNLGSYEVEK